MNYLTLNPYAILHGQVWRLLTWIVVPPEGLDLFTLVMLYFYFSIGTTLERTWGTFRYNVYLIGGMLLTIVGAFLFYGVCVLTGLTETITVMEFGVSLASFYGFIANYFSTYYVCMSIILAFAATFPDVQVLFMFIIPLKIKVLGIIYAVILGVQVLQDVISLSSYIRTGSIGWYLPLADMTAILFSLLAFIIFFVTTRKSFGRRSRSKRQRTYHKQVMRPVTKHKFAICGRTDESDQIWNFGSAQSATEIMSIVRIIFLQQACEKNSRKERQVIYMEEKRIQKSAYGIHEAGKENKVCVCQKNRSIPFSRTYSRAPEQMGFLLGIIRTRRSVSETGKR